MTFFIFIHIMRIPITRQAVFYMEQSPDNSIPHIFSQDLAPHSVIYTQKTTPFVLEDNWLYFCIQNNSTFGRTTECRLGYPWWQPLSSKTQCDGIITWFFFAKTLTKRHSIPRIWGGDLGRLLQVQIVCMCTMSCYIGPCYNGTQLHSEKNSCLLKWYISHC